jgi:uncharacterized protein YqfB (UPF0267 family)
MHICVTHVDSRTGIPCTVAPMSHGPAFPKIKGLNIVFGNQTQWPTNEPLFFGTCDDDADLSIQGVIKTLTAEEYEQEQFKENDTKAAQVRERRQYLLITTVDSINPMRWETLTEEQRQAYREYRQALLDVPEQTGFPWNVEWPQQP